MCSGPHGSPENKMVDGIVLKTMRMQLSLRRFFFSWRCVRHCYKKGPEEISFQFCQKEKLLASWSDVVALDRSQNIAPQQNAATSQSNLDKGSENLRPENHFV
jgi:hypothetical protein